MFRGNFLNGGETVIDPSPKEVGAMRRQNTSLSMLFQLSDILNSDEKNADFNMFIAEFSTYHDSCGISYGRDVIRDALSSEDNNEKPAHHCIKERSEVKLYASVDQFRGYLEVKGREPVVLEHHRSFDTHEALEIKPGIYEIRHQREYTPQGYRRAAD